MRAERRGGCPDCVCAGVAGKRGSERGANWCPVKERVMGRLGGCAIGRRPVKERVMGRLGGCATGRRAVTGRVGAATGAAGGGDPSVRAAG